MKEKKSEEGITIRKEDDFSEWYQQLMLKSGLADYSSVSGCIILRPLAYAMWEKIQEKCNIEFKKMDIQNAYFPLFIPERLLSKEAEHVKGFAPEVAWVTEAGNMKLNERLAIRPTSETIMYESYSKWIRSWRDLPLKLNQWNNVVRWEFNNPVPFFRTREFLWNEGHTVFATEKEALEEGPKIRKAYEKVCEELMALPGIYGKKTESEKFAGGIFSEKLHYIIPNGRVIEGPCFHHDGQNFAKAYDIKFLNQQGKEEYAWQNTFAISTRMLGTMFAMHSDDKGLVIPPRIAENKIVIIPILFDKTKKKVLEESDKIKDALNEFNPILDSREEYTPGRKYSEWELKGVPLRIEIGPKELEKKSVIVVKRNNSEKISVKLSDLKREIPKILNQMHEELFENAKKLLKSSVKRTENKKDMIRLIKEKNMVIVPLSNSEKVEEQLKADTGGAKVLFISPENLSAKGKKCIISGKSADYWVYVGRSY